MPPELSNDQELSLKKRARRRLVGAIALVVIMVIFLPQVLQDRVALTQQERITVTMPETIVAQEVDPAEESIVTKSKQTDSTITPEHPSNSLQAPVTEEEAQHSTNLDDLMASKDTSQEVANARSSESKLPDSVGQEAKVDKIAQDKTAHVSALEVKAADANPETTKLAEKPETKAVENKQAIKQSDRFSLQIGVYSDMANIKRLQEQLKQAGYSTTTEKLITLKGEGIRLKAGSFASRQDAVDALAKLKTIGLPGMVIND